MCFQAPNWPGSIPGSPVRGAALGGEIDGDAVAVRGEGHRGAEGGQHLPAGMVSWLYMGLMGLMMINDG